MKTRRMYRYPLAALLPVVAFITAPSFGWEPAEIMPEPPMSNSCDVAPHYDNANSRLYFGGDMPSFGMYYTEYITGWSSPVYIDLYLTYPGDMVPTNPFVTSDSQRMYFSSIAQVHPTSDLYYSDYSGSGWGTPIRITTISNDDCYDGGMCLNEAGNVMYFASIGRTGGTGEWDIWASTWTGGDWGTPELVNINTPSGEIDPFLYDGTLFFSSNRSGGYGRWDIWAADGSGTTFGVPYNLGPNINTNYIEKGPSVAPGTFPGSSSVTLLFDSYRAESNYTDIYTSDQEESALEAVSWGSIKASFE